MMENMWTVMRSMSGERKSSMWCGDEWFVNRNIGYSSCKLGNSEGHEVPTGSRDLGGPQSFLSGTSQGFDFYIGELEIVKMELESFDHTHLSSEGEPERLDFRRGLSFNRGRWRWERSEFKKDPRSVDDLPLSVAFATRLFVPYV